MDQAEQKTSSETNATSPTNPTNETNAAGLDSLFLESQVVEMLRTCYDPEIPVDIYELGLIYEVKVNPPGTVQIRMTLTSPQCPVAESLPPEVERKIRTIAGVKEAKVEVVWEPVWTMDKMSQAAKLQLGML